MSLPSPTQGLEQCSRTSFYSLGYNPLVVVVQSLSCVQLFAIPWTAAHQAPLSFTVSQSLLELMSIESVMPSHPLFPLPLLPSVFPRIRVFTIIIDCVAETAPDLPGLSALELEPSLEFCA